MKTLKTLKNALSYALGYVTVLGIAVLLIGLRKIREKFWTIVGRFLYRIGYLKDQGQQWLFSFCAIFSCRIMKPIHILNKGGTNMVEGMKAFIEELKAKDFKKDMIKWMVDEGTFNTNEIELIEKKIDMLLAKK